MNETAYWTTILCGSAFFFVAIILLLTRFRLRRVERRVDWLIRRTRIKEQAESPVEIVWKDGMRLPD